MLQCNKSECLCGVYPAELKLTTGRSVLSCSYKVDRNKGDMLGSTMRVKPVIGASACLAPSCIITSVIMSCSSSRSSSSPSVAMSANCCFICLRECTPLAKLAAWAEVPPTWSSKASCVAPSLQDLHSLFLLSLVSVSALLLACCLKCECNCCNHS